MQQPYWAWLAANYDSWTATQRKSVIDALKSWGIEDKNMDKYKNSVIANALNNCIVKPVFNEKNNDLVDVYQNWIGLNPENWSLEDRKNVITILKQYSNGVYYNPKTERYSNHHLAEIIYSITIGKIWKLPPDAVLGTTTVKEAVLKQPYWNWLSVHPENWTVDDRKHAIHNINAWGFGDGTINTIPGYSNWYLAYALSVGGITKPGPDIIPATWALSVQSPYFNYLANNPQTWNDGDRNGVISLLGAYGLLDKFAQGYNNYTLANCLLTGVLVPPFTGSTPTNCALAKNNTAYWDWIGLHPDKWTASDRSNTIKAFNAWGMGDTVLNQTPGYSNWYLANALRACTLRKPPISTPPVGGAMSVHVQVDPYWNWLIRNESQYWTEDDKNTAIHHLSNTWGFGAVLALQKLNKQKLQDMLKLT
jgi:hypothetical protein